MHKGLCSKAKLELDRAVLKPGNRLKGQGLFQIPLATVEGEMSSKQRLWKLLQSKKTTKRSFDQKELDDNRR